LCPAVSGEIAMPTGPEISCANTESEGWHVESTLSVDGQPAGALLRKLLKFI
jgi:hypothetical protein